MPRRHWKYDRQQRSFDLADGRRPAGYMIATPGARQGGQDDPGQFVPIELVNLIRPRVDAWREGGYAGVSATTRALLEHWYDPEQRQYRLFFCQLEAIETLIWLAEAPAAEKTGIEIPGDGGAFQRLCCKMATGSGKTIVMAMLIAWQALNKAANKQDARFSKNVLIVAPGLTVRKRLEVLQPSGKDNYYEQFGLVPDSLMPRLRAHLKVHIVNWHRLGWETEEKVAKKKGVDKRGAKSDEAYIRQVLGDMASARNLIVINDEAHHAWRIPAGTTIKGVSKEQKEEATKWIGGLDRIHKVRGILTCFDLSATPYIPSGKRAAEDALFDWIVSDFGLNDAIESGLVKTPRVVIRDDAVPDAHTFRSKLYHIYAANDENGNPIRDDLNRKAEPTDSLPDLIRSAYLLLGKDWLEWKKAWEAKGHAIPPVMITVCNRIETAARVKYAFDQEYIPLPELCKPELTLQIDSGELSKAEAQDEAIEIARDSDDDDGGDKPLTAPQRRELLRRMVDTIGKPGEPGAPIQHVISVAMLSEGWDAKTVTHIMGLRAFTSQLLCEQVVGRGLRRTSYELEDMDGTFKPEYVNVFGVPFSFMPHEEPSNEPPPPAPPLTRIEPLPEREEQYGITWPQVIRVEHVLMPRLRLDWAQVEPLAINAANIPRIAELAPTLAGKADVSKVTEIQLRDLGEQFRYQRLAFDAARRLFAEERQQWKGTNDVLFGQLLRIAEEFIRSDRLQITPSLFQQSELHRRVLLALSMTSIVRHLATAIRESNTDSLRLVLDEAFPIRSTSDMRPWSTSKACELTKRSHISHCVFDGTWEAAEAYWLDRPETLDMVSAWAKNDHLGFEVRYVFAGGVAKYRPDFLIRLSCGKTLVLEVKGQDRPRDKAKRQALEEWVSAVNADGRFGAWACDVSFSPGDVLDILRKHSSQPANV